VLDPLTGESVPLDTEWPWREQQQDPEALSRRQRRDQDYARHFLRWRRLLFALLARFCRSEAQTFLCHVAGETLTVPVYQPREKMSMLEKLFFVLHLERVPLLEAVAAGQLALIGNRLQPEGAASRAFVARLPIYVPGVLSWNQEPQCDTRAWLTELAWCNRASAEQETELLAQWDGRN
jgi:hypothetical protein